MKKWLTEFRCGRTSTSDAERSGRPKQVVTTEVVHEIHEIIIIIVYYLYCIAFVNSVYVMVNFYKLMYLLYNKLYYFANDKNNILKKESH